LYISPRFNSKSLTGLIKTLPLDYTSDFEHSDPVNMARLQKQLRKQVEFENRIDEINEEKRWNHTMKLYLPGVFFK